MAGNMVKIILNNAVEYELEIPDEEMGWLEELIDKFGIKTKPVKERW